MASVPVNITIKDLDLIAAAERSIRRKLVIAIISSIASTDDCTCPSCRGTERDPQAIDMGCDVCGIFDAEQWSMMVFAAKELKQARAVGLG